MRMIGIGLMGFLLAGVALLLSTMNILERGQRYVSELTDGPQLVFEDRRAISVSEEHTAVVYRSNPNHPVILSGLPAYQGVTFALPVDARSTSGYLQIDATSQVLAGVEGVLRISIDNTRRGEMLLRPGEVGHSLQIPLSPTDFASDELVVSFSLQGTGHHSRCSSDEGLEAVVEIETTSAVVLTLDRPLSSPRDLILTWGKLVRVGWPEWLVQEERVRRLALAAQFKQHGIASVFVSAASQPALSTAEMRAALEPFETKPRSDILRTWPVDLASNGVNFGVRRFHRSTQWRSRFEVQDLEEKRLPRALNLDLALGFLTDDHRWSVTTTLNGRLLSQHILSLGQKTFSAEIALPKPYLTTVNVIEVTVSAPFTRESVCDEGPELVAEMLPSSVLLKGDEAHSDEMSNLRMELGNMGPITLGTHARLTALDASLAVDLLAEILPQKVRVKPSKTEAQIVVLPPSSTKVLLPKTEPIWLVFRDSKTGRVMARALEGGAHVTEDSLAVLVFPNGLELGGVIHE